MCTQTAVKFSQTPGPSRDARVAAAMSHTGAAVAIGGVTALLGTLPLAGASSTVRTGRSSKECHDVNPFLRAACLWECVSCCSSSCRFQEELRTCGVTLSGCQNSR